MMEHIKIKVGADPFPPYQYYLSDGCIAGTDYERVISIFEKAGIDAEVSILNWDIAYAMLENKELDAAFQVQDTPERKARFHFSELLRHAVTEVVTSNPRLKIDSYHEIEEKGLLLGVIEGYTNGEEIDKLSASQKKTYKNTDELLLAISRGEVDLGIFDKGVKEYLLSRNGIDNIYSIESMTFLRPLYVVFNDPEVRDTFNQAMRSV